MKLEFLYSVNSEVQRVKQTIKAREIFKQFNYKLFFPEGININSKDFSNLKGQVEKELAPDKIKGIEKRIREDWANNSKYIKKLLDSIPYEKPESFVIELTRYGVGGSYWTPNRMIININYSWLDYFETAMHELIHILIEEPVIQEYKIKHESKEALVDYIMSHNQYLKKMFPDYKVQGQFSAYLPNKYVLDKLDWI